MDPLNRTKKGRGNPVDRCKIRATVPHYGVRSNRRKGEKRGRHEAYETYVNGALLVRTWSGLAAFAKTHRSVISRWPLYYKDFEGLIFKDERNVICIYGEHFHEWLLAWAEQNLEKGRWSLEVTTDYVEYLETIRPRLRVHHERPE